MVKYEFFRHLKVVLWKHYRTGRRYWHLTLLQIAIPIIFLITLKSFGYNNPFFAKIYNKETRFYERTTEEDLFAAVPSNMKLWYAPYTDVTEQIILRARMRFGLAKEDIEAFETEDDLLKQNYEDLDKAGVTNFAVIFRGNTSKSLDYDLRIHEKYLIWNTDKMIEKNAAATGSWKYLKKGFVGMQIALDKAFMEHVLDIDRMNISVSLQPLPDPPSVDDTNLQNLFKYYLPLTTFITFLFPLIINIRSIVDEFFSKEEAYMKSLGIKILPIVYGLDIYTFLVYICPIYVVSVILLCSPLFGPAIIVQGSWEVPTLLFLYGISVINFSSLTRSIAHFNFNHHEVGVNATIIWILTFFIPKVIPNMSLEWKLFFGLMLPNVSLQFGFEAIFIKQNEGNDSQNILVFESNNMDNSNIITLWILTSLLNLILCHHVWLWVCIWLKKQKYKRRLNANEPNRNKKVCLKVNNLTKYYGNFKVLENVSLLIPKNKISILLGENGKGKSTFLSILAQKKAPTYGEVLYFDDNGKICAPDKIRISFCPQNVVLLKNLTVEENCQFAARVLDIGKKREVDDKLKNVMENLERYKKEHLVIEKLHVGQKREVAFEIAQIADPDILILDEITANTDSATRSRIHSRMAKIDKTVIYATQNLHKANELSDSAFLVKGKTIEHQKKNPCYLLCLLLKDFSQKTDLQDVIMRNLGFTELNDILDNGNKLFVTLPEDRKEQFPKLFLELEQLKDSLKILTFALSTRSLHHIFNKQTGAENKEDRKAVAEEKLKQLSREYCRPKNCKSIKAIFLNRWYFLAHGKYPHACHIMLAMCIFVISMLLGLGGRTFYTYGGPALKLSLKEFRNPHIYYQSNETLVTPSYRNTPRVSWVTKEVDGDNLLLNNPLFGAQFGDINNRLSINCRFSRHLIHGAPISVNLAMDAVAKTYLGREYSISTRNHPFIRVHNHVKPSEISENRILSTWTFLIPIGYIFLLSSSIIFPNFEFPEFLDVQMRSGVRNYIYWFTNLSFDIILIMFHFLAITAYLMLTLSYHYGVFGVAEMGTLAVISVSFSVGILPCIYLIGLMGRTGKLELLMMGISTGVIPAYICCAINNLPKTLEYFFIISNPVFSVTCSIIKFSRKYVENYNWKNVDVLKRDQLCQLKHKNPCCGGLEDTLQCENFKSYLMNENFGLYPKIWYYALCPFIFYCFVVITCTSGKFQNFKGYVSHRVSHFYYSIVKSNRINHFVAILRCSDTESYNMSSQTMHQNIENTIDDNLEGVCMIEKSTDAHRQDTYMYSNGDIIMHVKKLEFNIRNLDQTYGRKPIIKNCNLVVTTNTCVSLYIYERFRLFTTLLGSKYFNKGDISISEYGSSPISAKRDRRKYYSKIGYCGPNFELNKSLTGKEIFTVMALHRGYEKIENVVELLLVMFDLKSYKNVPLKNCSPGIKRRFRVALTFLGMPPLFILLDPTSEMDPYYRSVVWKLLLFIKNELDTAIVLISHMLEEGEVLSDESFKIDEESHELRQFSRSQITFVMKFVITDASAISIIQNTFPNSRHDEPLEKQPSQKSKQQWYSCCDNELPFSELYKKCESLKTYHEDCITYYSIVQQHPIFRERLFDHTI